MLEPGGRCPAPRHRGLPQQAGSRRRDPQGPAKKSVIVGLSGGVDSAVAALALNESGYEVAGVTLELWPSDDERSCCSPDAVRRARDCAHAMGLPHYTVDDGSAFLAGVVQPFVAAYGAGETPNPCVECNPIRFRRLVRLADRLGARWVATGHYARAPEVNGRRMVARGRDRAKDQSYMLWRLDDDVLDRLLLPLGEYSKDEVRAKARAGGLALAGQAESQDVCFAPDDHAGFLAARGLAAREGDIVDRAGRVLGRHQGAWRFTVGQRRGLGLASPAPLYVLGLDAGTNRVVVGEWDELLTREVPVRDVVDRELGDGHGLEVQLRYKSDAIGVGRLRRQSADRVVVTLDEPFAGPAPGQSAVFYRDDVVVGGGVIAAPTGVR